jgi:serine/threonine protein kinase/Flp pilus assembly protein TadD
MSTKPPSQDEHAGTQDLDVTGVFSSPPADAASPTVPQFADPPRPVESPGVFATGVYLPDSTAAREATPTANPRNSGPEATGAFLPAEAGATGEFVAGAQEQPALVVPGGATGTFHTLPPGDPAEAPSGKTPDTSRCGRYNLKRFHARGGMGEIWLAEDPEIGRSVALKRMLEKRSTHQRRFLVEAQITGQLEHPGIVPVHELGVNEEGQPFYVMKFVRGRTLQHVIKEHHAAKAQTADRQVEHLRLLQIFLSLCQTVAYAHSRGVLHRDLKPENVMLGPFGETLLLDWGIAKVMGQSAAAAEALAAPAGDPGSSSVQLPDPTNTSGTQMGAIMGSPSYMSPELASGMNHEVDERSDVYLLGGTLFEILTGRLPREGTTAYDIIRKAQREPPPPPRKFNPEVSKPLNSICVKAMAQRKEDRYQSALALADDVQRYVAGEPVTAYQESFLERASRWAKRHRKAILRTTGAVLLLGLLVFGIVQVREAEQRRIAALREADELRGREEARLDVKEFHRLADEARFYAATTDPVAEHAPYFDPREGENKARAALARAAPWGKTLEGLPLPEEKESVKNEMYEVLLVLAQTISQRATTPESAPAAAKETLALLEEAGQLSAPSRSYYRLRAQTSRRVGDEKGAVEDQQKADDPQTPFTALDHFFLGEQFRTESTRPETKGEPTRKAWQSDPKILAKAIEEYRKALAIDPDHYWSQFQLGRCYLNLGRIGEAVEALGACVALRPKSPYGYNVRGLALAQEKRFLDAERDLDQALKLDPDSRAAQLTRGMVRLTQAKNDLALADFEAVLQPPADKQLLEAAYYRGQLYLRRGEVDKALKDFDRVVAEKPGLRPIYKDRALIHIAKGDTALALKDLDQYLGNGPAANADGWEAHAIRGHLLRFMYPELKQDLRQKPVGKTMIDLTVAQLSKAVALGGESADLFDDLAAMMELTGRPVEALAAYGKGIALAPNDVRFLIKRGWLHEALNDHDKAQADFAEAVGIAPDYAEAHTGLGYVRAMRKLPSEAQREADLALLNGADRYLILHNVACIYATLAQAGDRQSAAHKDAAMAVLRRAVQLWKQGGTETNEIDNILGDPALQILKDHPDFPKLVRKNEL